MRFNNNLVCLFSRFFFFFVHRQVKKLSTLFLICYTAYTSIRKPAELYIYIILYSQDFASHWKLELMFKLALHPYSSWYINKRILYINIIKIIIINYVFMSHDYY